MKLVEWLFFNFLLFLENRGRRYALVTFEGDVIAYKYCLLYNELAGKESGWPNLYIHQFVNVGGIDGEDLIHSHPHSTMSIILSGGYEEYSKKKDRIIKRTPGSVLFMSYKDKHSIVKVIPNTYTLFGHWFKRKNWEVGLRPCVEVCNRCKDQFGHCEKEINSVNVTDILEYPEDGKKWRGFRWLPFTSDLLMRLEIRKRAVDKNGIVAKKITEFTELKVKS